MVDSQIHTAGVITESVLQAFSSVPREAFLPEEMRGMAYVDEDLDLNAATGQWAHGPRVLMEPAILARMIQAVSIRTDDVVLNIGDRVGYSSAVLSLLAMTVITQENPRVDDFAQARAVWADQSYCNIATIPGDVAEGCPEHAPYSLIVLNGAVAEIPEILLSQLSLGGRLVGVHMPSDARSGTAVLVERIGEGKYSTRKLFDAFTPYIPGYAPKSEFVF